MQQHIFPFESELQNTSTPEPSSSHSSSVQERLATYGSEALDSVEHLGLILGDQTKAAALLQRFGSISQLACASVQELLPFVSRAKAVRVVSASRPPRHETAVDQSRLRCRGNTERSSRPPTRDFKPVIVYFAYSFVMVHKPSEWRRQPLGI